MRVVLPDPGGAVRTAQPWLSSALQRAGKEDSAGIGMGGSIAQALAQEKGGACCLTRKKEGDPLAGSALQALDGFEITLPWQRQEPSCCRKAQARLP